MRLRGYTVIGLLWWAAQLVRLAEWITRRG
jgi:hypothetical protein